MVAIEAAPTTPPKVSENENTQTTPTSTRPEVLSKLTSGPTGITSATAIFIAILLAWFLYPSSTANTLINSKWVLDLNPRVFLNVYRDYLKFTEVHLNATGGRKVDVAKNYQTLDHYKVYRQIAKMHDRVRHLQGVAQEYQQLLDEAEQSIRVAEYRNWKADGKKQD